MSLSTQQGQYDRLAKYERTGSSYEDDRYSSPFRRLYFEIRSNALLRLLECEASKSQSQVRVLEVGCGTGLTIEFLHRNASELLLNGVDISPTMLSQAEKKFVDSETGPKLQEGSAFNLPFASESFDAVYSTRFVHQFTLEEQARIYDELYRVTRPEGLVIAEFYGSRCGRSRSQDSFAEQEYPDARQVAAIVRADYDAVPLSFRGGQFIANNLGAWPVRCAMKALQVVPIRSMIHEYFVVSRRPK